MIATFSKETSVLSSSFEDSVALMRSLLPSDSELDGSTVQASGCRLKTSSTGATGTVVPVGAPHVAHVPVLVGMLNNVIPNARTSLLDTQ